MTKEEVLDTLNCTKLPTIICGFEYKVKNGSIINFITQHYIIGEYLAIYCNDRCIQQNTIGMISKKKNAQLVMNTKFRSTLNKLVNKEIEVLSIHTRKIIED